MNKLKPTKWYRLLFADLEIPGNEYIHSKAYYEGFSNNALPLLRKMGQEFSEKFGLCVILEQEVEPQGITPADKVVSKHYVNFEQYGCDQEDAVVSLVPATPKISDPVEEKLPPMGPDFILPETRRKIWGRPWH